MGHRDEPTMNELKRLLRRLDGLDGDKSLAKSGPLAGADQQGYVGALRGAPAPREGEEPQAAFTTAEPSFASASLPSKSSNAAIYIAAATAAIVSTLVVFLFMAWQRAESERRYLPLPALDGAAPGKLERQPAAGGSGQGETADGMVRRADMLIGSGEIEAARALLQRAAEMGSGGAALKLGRSYDPSQTRALNFADKQTNPALAKAWYERALALGTREAAAYLSQTDGK